MSRDTLAAALAALTLFACGAFASDASEAVAPLPALPEAARTDECGLPYFVHKGGRIYNPAYLAQVAADPGQPEAVRDAAWRACLRRLRSLRKGTFEADLLVYDYAYPYHGRVIEPPFPSAYAQAWWVRACMVRYQMDGRPEALPFLRRAARAFLVARERRGFLAPDGWLEEIPGARILNGHLEATLALLDAAGILGDPFAREAALRATAVAAEKLPLYDTGDWSRYDTDPDPREIMLALRSTRPPGDTPLGLAALRVGDPVSGDGWDPCAPDAWSGGIRLAGAWRATREIEGRVVRPVDNPRFVEPDVADLHGISTSNLIVLDLTPAPTGAAAGDAGLLPTVSLATNAREGERLECLGRDRQYPESYRFILLDAEAQRGTRILRFGGGAAPVADAAEPSPAGRRLLDRPNGVKYHRLHIDLLRRLAARPELRDTAWREVFRARAERFASYLKEGSPRDARPKAPRVRYARTDEIVLRDLSGAGWSAGNEPARLVDGDGDSVLILRPEELERTFAVTFTRPVALHGVGVDFYAAPFAPAGLAVDAGSVETFAFRESRPERFWMNLDPAPTTARAAFRFSGASEKGPVIVRELRFLVDPDRPALESLAAALPPLPRDRRPAWDELLVLEAALRGRFPLGRPAGGSIRETIDSGVAQCADRVALLGGLLDLHGIPWRPINFHNSPNIGDGHTALEIWHDGGWRYLDPSFGFWVPGPAGPLSFSDLSANPDRAAEGRPAPGAPDMKGIDTPDFFRRAEPAGPAGPLDPMLFPVSVGTAGVALGSYGPTAGPGSCRDLDSVVAPGIPAGLAYVGQSLEHRALVFRFPASDTATWRVTLVPAYRTDGKFELELSAEGGRLIGPASWRPAFVGFRTDEAQIMSLRFVQQLPGATLTVGFTPGRYPSYMELDAIRVERVVE